MIAFIKRLILRIRLYFAQFVPQAARWRNFDIEFAETVKSQMVEFNRSHPMSTTIPLPKPDLTPLHEAMVIQAPPLGANVRAAADTSGDIQGQVKKGDTILVSEKMHANDGYNWVYLQVKGTGIQGYTADTPYINENSVGFDWMPKVPPAPPPPPPPPPVENEKLVHLKSLAQDAVELFELRQDSDQQLRAVLEQIIQTVSEITGEPINTVKP